MKIVRLTIITLLCFMFSCGSLFSFQIFKPKAKNANEQKQPKKKLFGDSKKVKYKNILKEAEKAYNNQEYETALTLYRKVLVIKPKNELAIQRINEINKWTALLDKKLKAKDKKYKSRIKKIKSISSKKTVEAKKLGQQKIKLEQNIALEKKKQKHWMSAATYSNMLYEAALSLSQKDFKKAHSLTTKILMARPDSIEARDLLHRISNAEDEWYEIQKLKTALEDTQKKLIEEAKKKAEEKAIEKKEEERKKQIKESSPEKKGETPPVLDSEDMIAKKIKSALDEIVGGRFTAADFITDTHKLKEVEMDFLNEQSVVIYQKSVQEYEKDEKAGNLLNYNIRDLKNYKKRISEAYYWIGKYYAGKNKTKEAIQNFKILQEKFKDSDYLHSSLYALGIIYLNSNELKTALKYFEGVVDIPKILDNTESLSQAQVLQEEHEKTVLNSYQKIGQIYHRLKNYALAVETYRSISDKYPENASLQLEGEILTGETYLDQALYEKALELYTEVLDKATDPRQIERAQYNRAAAFLGLSKFELARTDLQSIITENPLNTLQSDAAYLLAESFFIQNNFPKAIIFFNKALNEYPDSDKKFRAKILLAKSYSKSTLFEKAIPLFEDIIDRRIKEWTPDAFCELGEIYLQQLKYSDSRNAFSELITSFPDHVLTKKARFLVGDTFFSEKKYSPAEKQYRTALRSDSLTLEGHIAKYRISFCLKELKKDELYEKYTGDLLTLDDYSRKIWDQDKNPQRAEFKKYYYKLLFDYGCWTMEKKKYNKAEKILKRVVSEFSEGEDSHQADYLIGKIYELKNLKQKALEHYGTVSSYQDFWGEQAGFQLKKLEWEKKYQNQAEELKGMTSESKSN